MSAQTTPQPTPNPAQSTNPPAGGAGAVGPARRANERVGPDGTPIVRRRPYQQRRKERSCDHCKMRKTKCDAHDNEACSACKAALLECKFSSTEHEGRKVGPAKRIRQLEKTVEELSRKIRELEGGQNKFPSTTSGTVSVTGGSSVADVMSTSPSPKTSYKPGRRVTPHDMPRRNLADMDPVGNTSSQARADGDSTMNERIGQDTAGSQVGEEEKMSWNPNAFGPGSAPHLIDSYKEFIAHIGQQPPPQLSSHNGNVYQPSPAVPLLSDFMASQVPLAGSIDLRSYLPPRKYADIVIEVFRRTIQTYKVPFYWPFLERKIDSAWEKPMMNNDSEAVAGVFCPVVMMLAVGCQLVDKHELPLEAHVLFIASTQERNGWHYFELARQHLNLNNPVYTLEDATVFVLMSLYLDKASLPSPCWLISGAMGRVCQDIGLHRKPPDNRFSPEQMEARIRLFWLAYIQDKRVAMKMGRPFILRAVDCDIPYPGAYLQTGITGLETQEQGGGRPTTIAEDHALPIDRERISNLSLQTNAAIIEACKVMEKISSMRLHQEYEKNTSETLELDRKFEEAWSKMPDELRDYTRKDVLDLPAVRALYIIQHARLNVFRFFTDFSPRRPITDDFRFFCLQQSIRISKVSAAVLFRCQQHPEFQKLFGVRTDDLVHLHIFRVAVILLLGIQMRNLPSSLSVTDSDLNVCIAALQAIARVHVTGQRFLSMYKEFARIFNHPSSHSAAPEFPAPGGPMQVQPNGTNPATTHPLPSALPPNQPSHPDASQSRLPIGGEQWDKGDMPWNHSAASSQQAHQLRTTNGDLTGAVGVQYAAGIAQQGTSMEQVMWSAPKILSHLDQGDFSDFQNMLSWDPGFMESFGGPADDDVWGGGFVG